MAGLVPPELKRRFDERVSPHHGLKQARIGAVINGEQVVQAPGRQGWVYVTLTEPSDVGVTEAINLSTRWAYGAPVYVRRGPRGHMEVIGVDAAAAVSEAGNSATMLTVPDIALTGIVDERRFEPGLVQAKRNAGVYTMSVYINSFVYTAPDGTRREYPGGWLDLTSYVPATEGKRRWALVGVNMVTNTAAAVAGDEYGLATTLDMALLNEIDPGDVKPLAGVNLSYGMTAVDSDNLILDARAFLDGGGAASGETTIPGAGAWNPDLAPATPDADDDEFDDASLGVAWTEVDADSVLTVTEASGMLTLANSGAASALTGVQRAAPATDFQIVTKLAIRIAPTESLTGDWCRTGIALTFPTVTGYAFVCVQRATTGWQLQVGMEAEGVSTYQFIEHTTAMPDAVYLRLRYNSANEGLSAEVSEDALTWSGMTIGISAFGEAPDKSWLWITSDGTTEADFAFYRVRDGYGAQTDPVYGRNEDVTASYVPIHTDDVSAPPTDAELDAAIGTPADVGAGYVALLDDNGAGDAMYLIASDGTNWWHAALTKAT